jgi:DNA-binding CsgD family transcriptional regulator
MKFLHESAAGRSAWLNQPQAKVKAITVQGRIGTDKTTVTYVLHGHHSATARLIDRMESAATVLGMASQLLCPRMLDDTKFPLPSKPDDGEFLGSAASLTALEADVWQLLSTGHSNEEIALRIGKSAPTVRNATSRLYRKLPARNRADAAALWQQQLPPPRLKSSP